MDGRDKSGHDVLTGFPLRGTDGIGKCLIILRPHSRNQQKAWPLLPHAGALGPQSNSASDRPQEHEWRLIMSQQATSLEILDQVRDLDDIEDMAVQLATLAGAEIVRTFGGIFTVRYKTGDDWKLSVRDRVSEGGAHVGKLGW